MHPQNFGAPPEQAIINELNKKYANRVLHDVGLCVCVFDLSEVGQGKVRYGDGFLWYKGMSHSPFSTQKSAHCVCDSDLPLDCLPPIPLRGDPRQSQVV